MYLGTLTDISTKKANGQPNSIKFRDKSVFEVMTHFSMIIEDCSLEKVKIKITKENGKEII
tara:strand:- start:439 stop:621 length:183 start_codon:yes stop_codon:yes gene_type:complete